MNHIGEYLRRCREKSGATQLEVSKYVGYDSAQYISTVENCRNVPPLDTVKKWSECVGANKELVLKLMTKAYKEKVGGILK